MNSKKNFYIDTNMSEQKCQIILGKQSKNKGKPCNRPLPCRYHSELSLEKQNEIGRFINVLGSAGGMLRSRINYEDKANSVVINHVIMDFA